MNGIQLIQFFLLCSVQRLIFYWHVSNLHFFGCRLLSDPNLALTRDLELCEIKFGCHIEVHMKSALCPLQVPMAAG